MIQTQMDMETIWNTSMDKLRENHSEAIVVELLSVHQLLTDGVALIQMAMVGLTRQRIGLPAQEVQEMLGLLTQLNGMTGMVMAEETTHKGQQQISVQTMPVLQ